MFRFARIDIRFLVQPTCFLMMLLLRNQKRGTSTRQYYSGQLL